MGLMGTFPQNQLKSSQMKQTDPRKVDLPVAFTYCASESGGSLLLVTAVHSMRAPV